jgi:hypothetical protein
MTHICLSIFKKNFGGLKEREKKADVTHVTFFQVLLDFLDLSLSSANLSAISAYKLSVPVRLWLTNTENTKNSL